MHIGIDFLASFEKVRKIELICLHARYVCSCVYLFDLVLSPPPCQVSEADSKRDVRDAISLRCLPLSLFLKTQVVEEAKALSKKAKQSLQISSSPPVVLKISENGSSSKSL